MAAKKRSSSRSRPTGLVDRAVRVGRKALREAESRVPTDVRRQLERSIKDGQKTLKTAIDQLQKQVRRTAKQADVEKALKRLDGLSKQVQQLARGVTSPSAPAPRRTPRRARSTTRKAAAATKKRTTPARKPAARATARRTSPAPPARATRRSAPRRAPAPPAEPEPMAEAGDAGT